MEIEKKSIGTKVTIECHERLKLIGQSRGKYPTGVASNILELFRNVSPENYEQVCAAIVRVGREKSPSV